MESQADRLIWEVVWVEGQRARIKRKVGKLDFRITVELPGDQRAVPGARVETDMAHNVTRYGTEL
jgi:hypothetical protein